MSFFVRLLVGGLLLGLITFWFHRRLVRATGISGRWAVVADVTLVLLAAASAVGFQTGGLFDPAWARPIAYIGMTWLAVGMYLIFGITAIGVCCLVARLVRRLRGRPSAPPDPSRRRVLQAATGAVTLAALGTVGAGIASAARPGVTHTTIPLRRLPAGFDGVRVALVTDLHVGPTRGRAFTQRVVDLVAAEKPDLIVFGGDLIDGTVAHVGRDLEPLADLHAPLGVFGVSGNHEYYADNALTWLDHWETLGIRTLRNQRVELRRGGDVIDLAGVYDATGDPPPDISAALAGRDPNRFVVLAAHQPKQVDEGARQHSVDLQLSGHTHGGQLWPFGYVVTLQQPMLEGLARFDDTLVYTSRGVGAWGPPVRVGAAPEVSMLELRREA